MAGKSLGSRKSAEEKKKFDKMTPAQKQALIKKMKAKTKPPKKKK